MKQLFSTAYSQSVLNIWLLLLRIGVGAFMLTHGVPKLMKLLGGDLTFADPFGLGAGVSLVLIVFAEALCSIFIFVGLGTRLASIPLIITMLVATFIQHADDPFGRKELALLYLLIYVTLLVLGSGKYSIDALISKNKRRSF
jgi:putative oxidoreductase